DVLRQARAAGCRSRFIFIVTRTGDIDDAGLIGEGADDYLAKDQITAPLLDRALRYALQRHHLDEARRESEGRFEQLANATPALLYVTDARGEHVFFNQSWLDFRGVARGAETLESWREAIHPEDRDRLAAHFARWL